MSQARRWLALVAALLVLPVAWGGVVRAAGGEEPATHWSVTFVGPDDQAVPGARVTLRRVESLEERHRRWLSGETGPLLAEATTGADGVATLAVPEGARFSLRVEAPGFLPLAHWLALSEIHHMPPRIPLAPDPGLELRVLDPEGRPLPGARVHRRHFLAGPPAVAGEDGRARSAHPAFADRPGGEKPVAYRVVPPPGRTDLSPSPWVEVDAAPGEPFRGEVVLQPARPQRLRVLNADGAPAAGALVRLVNRESPRPHERLSLEVPLALADAEGLVEVPRPLSGDPLTLRLVGPDLDWATVELAPPSGSEEAAAVPSEIRLQPPGSLELRVVGEPDGDPVPGAQVVILPGFAGRTGGDGGLTVRWPSPSPHPPSRYPIQVSASGYAPASLSQNRGSDATGGTSTVIRLTPLASLAGRILDTEGRPVAGARILVLMRDSPFPPGRFPSQEHSSGDQISGPDGRFRVVGPPPHRPLALRAEAPGHAPAEVGVQAVAAGESRSGIEIVLAPGRRVRVSVLGADGAPVAGTNLEVSPHGPGQGDLVRTAPVPCDPDGLCTVAGMTTGRFDLRATAPGHAVTWRRGVEVSTQGGTETAVDMGVIYLEPEALIAGRVSAAGSPLAGARVWASPEGHDPGDDPLPETRSGEDGRFSLRGLATGTRVHVHAHAEGHPELVVPSVEAPRRDLEIELPAGATVRGRVVDESGAGIERAWVRAYPAYDPAVPHRSEAPPAAVTDEEGAFLLEALPAGDLTLMAHGGALRHETTLRLEPGQRLDGVRLVLKTGERLSVVGRVVDGDGLPLAGARVSLNARRSDGMSSVGTSTSRDGTFSLNTAAQDPGHNGEPLTYELQVDHPGHLGHRRPLGTAEELAALDLERNPLEIVLTQGGTTLSGVVVGENGEPVAGATVLVEIPTGNGMSMVGFRGRSRLAVSGPDGAFTLRDVEPGSWLLIGQHPAWADAELDDPVEVGSTPIEGLRLVLERGATFLVRVTGLDARELAAVRLRAEPMENSAKFHALEGRPDHEGVARLAGAWPGEWRLTATLDGTRMSRTQVTVTGEDREVDVEMPFGEGSRLSGELWVNGEPRSGVRLTLYTDDQRAETVTGPGGRFSFPGVADGEYRLTSVRPRFERRVTVLGSHHLRLDLETGAVTGHVTDAMGAPLRARVELIPLDAASGRRYPTTSQSGLTSFRFEVPPGSYGLRISAAGHQTREFQVQAVPGAEGDEMTVILPREEPAGAPADP